MHWFQGNIAEAVAKSKALNAVFVVFVEGTDQMSRDLAGVLEASEVAARLSDQNKFLSVRLSSTDQNYTHFAQIYTFVPVPSIFFIGRDGSPLEVVCAGVTTDMMIQRIDKILELHYSKTSHTDQTSAPSLGSSGTSAAASASFIEAESASTHTSDALPSQEQGDAPSTNAASKDDAQYEIVCDGDVCTRRPKQSNEKVTEITSSSTSAAIATEAPIAVGTPTSAGVPTSAGAASVAAEAADVEARRKRAQELIEARRREKEAKEREEEKQRELERRATGHGVAELKQWQHEQELKQAAEERRRERQANEEARQRVLQQIAQDRAERHARHPPATSTSTPAPTPTTHATASTATVARLQLKMADGNSHVATFAPDDTMADVYAYVREHTLVRTSSFTLWTAFPRRALSADDATLSSLGLAPSAALLLLPADQVSTGPAPAANLYAFITSLFSTLIVRPALDVWSWISSRVFPQRPAPPPSPPPARAAAADGLRYRGGSNVHRLREAGNDDEDDDNNTWNGNSTQQM